MATATKKKNDMVLTDNAEKFYIVIKNGDKQTQQKFNTEEEAMAFLPKVLQLRSKAKDIRIMFRVSYYRDDHLYAPHEGELTYDKSGEVITTPKGRPIRQIRKFPTVKGKLYCPECGFYTVYKMDSDLGVKCCEGCGISVGDWYVKTCNNLWETFKPKGDKK